MARFRAAAKSLTARSRTPFASHQRSDPPMNPRHRPTHGVLVHDYPLPSEDLTAKEEAEQAR